LHLENVCCKMKKNRGRHGGDHALSIISSQRAESIEMWVIQVFNNVPWFFPPDWLKRRRYLSWELLMQHQRYL
jgi:hypothetical protein